jgi:hypothetical protein
MNPMVVALTTLVALVTIEVLVVSVLASVVLKLQQRMILENWQQCAVVMRRVNPGAACHSSGYHDGRIMSGSLHEPYSIIGYETTVLAQRK